MSTLGGGGTWFKGIQIPSGAPFAAGSADNGLSIDPVTGKIVLGNDVGSTLAQLLSDREIPLNGFDLTIFQNAIGNGALFLQPDPIENTLSLSMQTGLDSLGNFGLFSVAPASLFGQAGDAANGGTVEIDPVSARLSHNVLTRLVALPPFPGGVISAGNGSSDFLRLDIANQVYSIGDIDAAGNGVQLSVNDLNRVAKILDSAGDMLSLDRVADLYVLGDFSGVTSGTAIFIDAANPRGEITSNAGSMLLVDQSIGLYLIGDFGGVGNGSLLAIDDTTSLFKINNTANNAVVEINGVAGFTGTVAAPGTITVDGGIVTNVA